MKKRISECWKKLKFAHKIGIAAITAVIVCAFIFLGRSDCPSCMTPLFTAGIADGTLLNRISLRLDQEGVKHQIGQNGMIYVREKEDARRMVTVLLREDLVPSTASPWDVFKMDRWNTTDFERNVNLRRALTENLEQHIESLDDIVRARVTLVIPEKQLFTEDQNKVSASIIITPRDGSDITSDRKKIDGIVKLVKFAVEGLDDENITISDNTGTLLNDCCMFGGFDRIELTRQEMQIKAMQEKKLRSQIITALNTIYGGDRVQIINLDLDMDITSRTVSTEEKSKTASAGGEIENKTNIYEEKSPWTIRRICAAVAIDGTWRCEYGKDGRILRNPDGSAVRTYTPVSDAEIQQAKTLVEHAVGFSQNRGDSVTVQCVKFDRSRQFAEEDFPQVSEEKDDMLPFLSLDRNDLFFYCAVGFALLSLILVIFLCARGISGRKGSGVRIVNARNLAMERPEEVADLIKSMLAEE
ncbi:MAG: flagellar M-ring protein FliF [Spirochaetia bacterium]|nr:flagellar M-ring protein FliF [Spirochaetia bacterium]